MICMEGEKEAKDGDRGVVGADGGKDVKGVDGAGDDEERALAPGDLGVPVGKGGRVVEVDQVVGIAMDEKPRRRVVGDLAVGRGQVPDVWVLVPGDAHERVLHKQVKPLVLEPSPVGDVEDAVE